MIKITNSEFTLAVIEETEESMKEDILRALQELSAKEIEKIDRAIVWVYEFLIILKFAVYCCVLQAFLRSGPCLAGSITVNVLQSHQVFTPKPMEAVLYSWKD